MNTHKIIEYDEDILGRIYEAGLIPELWSSVIERIAEITGSFGGSIYTCGAGYSAIAASDNCQEHLADMISLGWAERNIRAERLVAQKHNGFGADHDYCTEEEIENHPIYTEFLRPRGLGWTAGTYIKGAGGDFAIFSIDQLNERGPITPSTVTYLNGLRPHIARASALAMQVSQQQGRITLSHLEALGIPALLVSHNGKVQQVNSLFDRIGDEIRIGAQDKIILNDSRAQSLLRVALSRPSHEMGVQSIPVLAKTGVALWSCMWCRSAARRGICSAGSNSSSPLLL